MRCDQKKLKYVSSLNDESLTEDTDPDYELRYIDIGNVTAQGEIVDTKPYRFSAAPSRARRKVRNGDVIISTVRTYLQAIASIENPPENLTVSTGFAVVRPKQNVLIPDFCKYALRNPQFINEVICRSVGISYPAINASDLADISISIPPLSTQTKIANFLDRKTADLDQLIAAKKHLLELLDEKKRALIARAVTRGLNPDAPLKDSGVPWLGMIPEHWEVERARWLFKQSSLPIREDDAMVTCFRDGTVTLRSNRREEGFTNAVLELGYQGIRKGQLVLHSMDAFAGAIGVSDSDGKCTPEYVICDPVTKRTHSAYYGLLLREMALQQFIQARCSAVRERAPRIRFNQFKDFFLPVLPLGEQIEIVQFIEGSLKEISQLKLSVDNVISLLQERRVALISAAVTGKISEEALDAY
jgi:type I restriction enzyme S subunit